MKADEAQAAKERDLVRLYMDLTGASEATARGVLMYVCCPPETPGDLVEKADLSAWEQPGPVRASDASGAQATAEGAASSTKAKERNPAFPRRERTAAVLSRSNHEISYAPKLS
jgi:hypothetical protein